jgi:hypothetical protein
MLMQYTKPVSTHTRIQIITDREIYVKTPLIISLYLIQTVFIVKPPKFMLQTQCKWYVLITQNMQCPVLIARQQYMSHETTKVNPEVK